MSEKYIPTVDEVQGFADTLSGWTDMAAQAYGLYSGINIAIKTAADKGTEAALMAHELRQQLALMAVIRCFAILDRNGKVSFQSVNRLLKSDRFDGLQEDAVVRFRLAYADIDFEMFKRLQSFRNKAIAHVSWNEAEQFIRYGELEKLIRTCCTLAHELNMMVRGNNHTPARRLNDSHDDALRFWSAVLRDDPDTFAMV